MSFPRDRVVNEFAVALSLKNVPEWASWLRRNGGIPFGDGLPLGPDNGFYGWRQLIQPPPGYPVTALGEPRRVFL